MYFLKLHELPGEARMVNAMSSISEKERALRDYLSKQKRVIVLYSGGVDSALLAVIARDELGECARVILLDSPLLSRRQFREARERASALGIPLHIIPFPILDDPGFRQNLKDRCYRCKKRSSWILREALGADTAAVVDGVNTSDLQEFRPGLRACEEEGILHPYVECGISKNDIREIARSLGLSFWNHPSSACLASRVVYGEELTDSTLLAIETGEELLHSFGLSQVRLRSHGDLARIEVLPPEFPIVLRFRKEIAEGLRRAGYRYSTLDIEGFRSGSMDEGSVGKEYVKKSQQNPYRLG
ncbi:MAG TPA: ATP-dependent sacrificial sulfur transferase LarE [Methanoregulaceae archaeon]|nr:MAG: ATP-dependent sacrificial sulfur transferase LarE [Methanolinea sp.]HON82155.1 ATP-dependent sacrificial sulfur transferase LarE [Methanoregulaceae archaeon]HPD10897.1 ATP-dependent sacrificial sulfur transferase LarE [Methanoregulaceae archaeon]